jgi:hypothetical protein
MAIQCPALEWPTSLEERGPVEDPSIVLRGTARIGGTPAAVVAIRIKSDRRRAPDYKVGVPAAVYQVDALETIVDELDYLVDEIGVIAGSMARSLIHLSTGDYVLWLLPSS